MHKTLYRRSCSLAAVLALLMFLLSGCSIINFVKEQANEQQAIPQSLLDQFMICVENNDMEGAAALCSDPDQMRRDFPGIAASWPVHSSDPYELTGMATSLDSQNPEETASFLSGKTQMLEVSTYRVHCSEGDYEVRLGVLFPFEEDSRIESFDVISVQELIDSGIEPAGTTFPPVAKKSAVQWLLLAYWVLSLGLGVFTIVDVIRKKQKLYGLWIAAILLYAVFYLNRNGMSFGGGMTLGILSPSYLLRYQGDVSRLQFSLPVGTILYWIFRNKLPKRASEQQAQPAVCPPEIYKTPLEARQYDKHDV